ncbi:MAG: NAD(+)/NADH kinase [Cyanobacteria bacterium SIG30]|nr:NAD(+)/NADH kinase [Cyanobacteria bacterium SIG30]
MKIDINKISIVYNPDIEGAFKLACEISKKLENSSVVSVHEISGLECVKNSNLLISVGGDGTLLRCANYCAPLDIKIFGFNLGRLGFLAQAKPDDIDDVIKKIRNGDFKIEERLMLKAKAGSNNLIALNDIVIKGASFSRTSILNLYINDKLISNYLADGLIISTPTGSTAYTLSAGGPVVCPNLNAFVIVPICPHTLSARPLVIPTNEKIKITMSDCVKFHITADGQSAMDAKDEVVIEKYEKSAKLLLLQKNSDEFYDVLREKLHWGQKPEK